MADAMTIEEIDRLRRRCAIGLECKSYMPEYGIWNGMINRCTNPNSVNYHHYGGRGITIAQEWLEDYFVFLAHVGLRPSPKHSIDRIDVNGHYQPGNVKWSTPTEQANNKRGSGVYLWLPDEELHEIRQLIAEGYSDVEIILRTRVATGHTISRIRAGRNWDRVQQYRPERWHNKTLAERREIEADCYSAFQRARERGPSPDMVAAALAVVQKARRRIAEALPPMPTPPSNTSTFRRRF